MHEQGISSHSMVGWVKKHWIGKRGDQMWNDAIKEQIAGKDFQFAESQETLNKSGWVELGH